MAIRKPLVLINGSLSQLPAGDTIYGAETSGAYTRQFNATTDWGSAVNGIYSISVSATTHGCGTSPLIQVFSANGDGTFSPLPNDFFSLDKILFVNNSNGDVSIKTSSRFAGKLVCSNGGQTSSPISGITMQSPNGSLWVVSVDNSGNIVASPA